MSSMPRLSASLVVVSPKKNVLMLKRPVSGSFPNIHVFPGGALDDTDPGLQYCALRETFEETGLLINSQTRESLLLPRKTPYAEALKQFPAFTPELRPVSEWTTPAIVQQKQFTTQFYIFEALEEHNFDAFEADGEVISVEWMKPSQCLTKYRSGEIQLYPPQYYLLSYLEQYTVDQVASKLKDRIIKPKPVGKQDGGVLMDWGEGEKAVLKFEGKQLRGIKFKL